MGKLIKILFGLILALVLLIVAAAVIIPLVVDPNDFKGEIVQQVKKATGRDLAIEGDIGLSVFPWLGVELGVLSLSQPPGFGDRPFAAVQKAQVRAKLMPLLKKQLEVDRIELVGLQANLIRNAEGVGNWEDLAKGGEGATPGEADKTAEGKEGLRGLAIGGVSIADAQVRWDDRQAGQQIVIQEINLNTGALSPGAPVDLELSFAVDNKEPALTGRLRLAGTVTATDDNQRITLKPFELGLVDVKTADGLTVQSKLTATVTADLAGRKYQLDGLQMATDVSGEQIPGGKADITLAASVLADLAADILKVQGLNIKSGDLHLSGNLDGAKLQSDPAFTGKLNLAPVNLRQLMERFGVAPPLTADPAVLQHFALSAEIAATKQQAALEKLYMQLDDSKLSGNLKVLLGQPQGYRFALGLDTIDLDRYLPPPSEQPVAEAPEPAAGQPARPQPLFPVEQLRQLDIDGTFTVGSLTAGKLKMQKASIQVKAKDGDLRINDRVGAFYQGDLTGNLGVNVQGGAPRVALNQTMQGIQAEPLLADLTGKGSLSGTGRFFINVNGSGQSVDAIKRSLGGKLNFAFTDGAVNGFNLGRMLREATAKLKGQRLPPDQEAEKTDFSELSGSAVISNGVLDNRDLNAKSPLFRITGSGTVDIGRETLDYKVKPVLVSSLEGQGGKELDNLQGVPIPVHLTGPLAKPNWSVDLAEALTESQKGKIKEKVGKEIEKALGGEDGKKLPGGLDGVMKGLFN
jgi:AsmA protein